jgi:hypothetical protein
MEKLLLKDIEKDTFRRSTLIAIPGLRDLLEINDEFTYREVFFGIVRDALQEYEKYIPAFIQSSIYINPDERMNYDFVDNFDLYLQGRLDEENISLIPIAVLGLTTGSWTNTGSLIRQFRYDPPRISELWFGAKSYTVQYLANRPIYEEYDEVTKEYTDKCAIYYMSDKFGSKYKVLKDQIYVELCRYLMNMRKNLMLQNLPVELFQGLEEDYQKVDSELKEFYLQSMTYGQYLR